MAAISAIASKGIHVPAYAGCISRLLAPKVARPSRRPWSALQLHAPASRRVPHFVSQPTPPQGTSEPAADPRRHGLSNSVAPAARKRSASAATGACCAVTLRTAPCPLRSLALPARSLRGLRKPRSGSCSAGDEKNEKDIHPCTSTSDYAHSFEKMLITSRRFARSVAPCSKASHAEKNARIGNCGKLPGCAPYDEHTGRRAALYHWRFSAPPRFHVEGSGEANRCSRTFLFELSRSFC